MIQPLNAPVEKLAEDCRNIPRPGRRTHLVRHHHQIVRRCRPREELADEIGPGPAIRPLHPHHRARAARGQHGAFTRQFGGAIEAERPWLIVLAVGRASLPSKTKSVPICSTYTPRAAASRPRTPGARPFTASARTPCVSAPSTLV